jgi:hypothetical protein
VTLNFPGVVMGSSLALSAALLSSVSWAIGQEHFEPSRGLAEESLAAPNQPGANRLTAERVKTDVGVELARLGLQLVDFGVRLDFKRERAGEWFAHVDNPRTGCELSTSAGTFDALSVERAQSIALALEPLIARCATVEPSAADARRERASAWVKPTAAVHAGVSLLGLLSLSGSSPPNLSLALSHAPSSAAVAGFSVATLGSGITLFLPREMGERTLPLSFFSSGALLSLSIALGPEQGVPTYSGYSLMSGYALTSAWLAIDWAVHPVESAGDAEPRASAPSAVRASWACFVPAAVGSVVSMAPALAPTLEADDRELVLGLGSLALVPAVVGIALSASERHSPTPLVVGGGPRASAGLSLSGAF